MTCKGNVYVIKQQNHLVLVDTVADRDAVRYVRYL